jgi:protein-tyrosine kinase
MSKIIQALEKAKSEGSRNLTGGLLDERATVGPIEPGVRPETQARATRKQRGRGTWEPVMAQAFTGELLRGVDPHIETLHRPMSLIAEQFRTLRSRLERSDLDGRIRTLAVTSSIKGEGKSLTAANLAAVMASDTTKRVLLVDADLRRPRQHTLLSLAPSPGLAEVLQGQATYEDVVRATPWFELSVVMAGNAEGHPAELLASPNFASFMERVRQDFDYAVIDTPPLQPISDVQFLTDNVDGVILVVRANKTSKGLLKHSVEGLPPGKIVGAVLNRVDGLVEKFGYRYSKGEYYYRYY